ncbi:MAG: hypothetical protein V3T72_15285 [Thermoanaerobaculia bacterium]
MRDSQNRIFAIAFVVVSLVVLAVLLEPVVEDRLAPEPVAAWVAIEVGGRGAAEIGRVAVDVGTPFRLHAVLEARDRGGETVYYTEAPGLRFGTEEVPASRLRRWQRRRTVKIRWFTVEGERPFVELDPELGIATFKIKELLRSDWPLTWSVPGEIDAANDDHLERGDALPRQIFGTQRYHVRIEIYRQEDDLIADKIIRSWGKDDLRAQIDRFPTVSMTVPGIAGPASRVFGLSQLVPPADAGAELLQQIDELGRHDVAFSRLTVLRDQIRRAGTRSQDLLWRTVDLQGEARWDDDANAGDLLRVGDRMVVLYEDRGAAGVVDHGDLCFDFEQGASVRTLGDVFGRGDGGEDQAVELASLRE